MAISFIPKVISLKLACKFKVFYIYIYLYYLKILNEIIESNSFKRARIKFSFFLFFLPQRLWALCMLYLILLKMNFKYNYSTRNWNWNRIIRLNNRGTRILFFSRGRERGKLLYSKNQQKIRSTEFKYYFFKLISIMQWANEIFYFIL